MNKVKFKLQNLIFSEKYGLDEHWWLAYRTSFDERMKYDNINSCYVIGKGNHSIDFFTYFNSITVSKWRKYTQVEDITLNLKMQGEFRVILFGHYKDGDVIPKEWLKNQEFNCQEPTEISISFPKDIASTVCAFHIEVISEVKLYSGYYSTYVDEDKIRDVNLSIATTTFNNEEYITKNMQLLERELFYSDEVAGQHIVMRVVDNGRTLDPEKYNNEYITIYPNQNVGGAGGFTRGMLESLKAEKKSTHVLLMDDDVKIMPESLIRTYSLLALLKDEYDSHFISGAMLFMEHMNIQHEDVGYIRHDGSFGPRKPGFNLIIWDQVLANEAEYPEIPNSYAGWWYCCIPTKTIDTNNLPIPLFIRGDDVEYSINQNAKFITLGGICIWHRGFVNKYNAALELYLVHRNSMITQSMSGVYQDIDFMKRIDKFFWKEIKRLNYSSCELLLDSIEDYLNGPEFMMTPQGERIMKQQGAKNEVMIDIPCFSNLELDLGRVCEGLYDPAELKGFKKFWYDFTRNGHRLPKRFLSKDVAVVPYDWFEAPAKQYLCDKVLAVSAVSGTANLRIHSKKKYKELIKRRKRLLAQHRRSGKSVEQEYQKAATTLKSREFWEKYLEI